MTDQHWAHAAHDRAMYSRAERCACCDRRAVLDRAAAERLVTASGGRLVPFVCPDRPDHWHLRNPTDEHARN